MREPNLTDPAASYDPMTPTASGDFWRAQDKWHFELYDNTIDTEFEDIFLELPEDIAALTLSVKLREKIVEAYKAIDIEIKWTDALVIVDGRELPDLEELIRATIKCPACGNKDPELIDINYPVVVSRRLHSIEDGFLHVSDFINYGEEWNDEHEFLCKKGGCYHTWEVPAAIFEVLEWSEPL